MLAEDVRTAAASGQSQELARLLSRPDSNKFAPDSDGRTALHLATAAGHTDCTASLIIAGAPVNALDSSGCTALQIAASEGYELILDQLLKHGANPNNQDNVHGNTALHEATWKGFSRSVAVLCKGKANMHIKNFGGFAALHLCCQNGHNQSCRELLIAGCSPDLQNNYGDTPLHTSARYGHAGVTRILISAHSRVSDQNKNGDTALHIAAAMGRRKMTRILIEAGCDKTLRNKQQETAKDIATRKDLNEIITILNNTKRSSHKKKEGQDQTDDHKSQHKDKRKHKSENKVHFEKPPSKNWSPYGCHYYPDSKNFPAPNLDSLPNEPLHRGEQYFLDLAGNIRKGPVGVGYMCYCAPFFQHMEARLERDKEELKKHINSAEKRIDKKVQNLERQTEVRISQLRKQHQHLTRWLRGESYLPRTRSLDLLDDKSIVNEDKAVQFEFGEERRRGQADHKSMDDLCSDHESEHGRNHDHFDKVGHFWRTQFSSERLRRPRGLGYNKTKCPDLVSSVTQNTENCNTLSHNEDNLAMRETVVKDLTKSYAGDVESGLPSWRRSVHEVSRVPVLQWRSDEAVDRYSDSSDVEDCERPGPWAEVKRLPYRSRSAVYSPTLDNNDSSGYSTKICSNSQGPSPSLSGRLQGDDLHVTKFYIDPGHQSGLPLNKTHHAVPFHHNNCPLDQHYIPASVSGQPTLDTHSSSAHDASPLDPPYLNPSSLDRTSHYPIPSGLTPDRFTANECQNLHSEASLV